MKRQLFLTALLAFALLASCRRTNTQPSDEMSTFSQAQQPSGADRSHESYRSHESHESHETQQSPIDLTKQRVGRGVSDRILTRKAYVTSYNKQTRCPNWVAWTLTKAHTYGNIQRENERFEEDTDVATPRATFQDFYNSRYDRGHMCPAGDNKWDEEAMTQSFLLTNICPQNHGLNKEDWNDLEMQCRTWARRYGEITIVCGPLFEDENPRQIGRNHITVPSGFFKVVCRMKPKPAAVGFIFKNNGSSQPWRQQVVSIDDVEKRTGFDFFHTLPDDVENTVEAMDDIEEW